MKHSSFGPMKTVIIVVVSLTMFVLFMAGLRVCIQRRIRINDENIKLLLQSNGAKILQDCRDLIRRKDLFKDDEPFRPRLGFDASTIFLYPKVTPFSTNVPASIRYLKPQYIAIDTNKVTLCLSVLPHRYLNAFKEGVPQHGSEKIADGLWMWYGHNYGSQGESNVDRSHSQPTVGDH